MQDIVTAAGIATFLVILGYSLGCIATRKSTPRKPLPTKVTDEMVTKAMGQILGNDNADFARIGINQPRSEWWFDIKRGLEKALEVEEI